MIFNRNLWLRVGGGFPNAPTAYNLIDTYKSTQTFTAPEDGWYQIELFGRSGAGGDASGGKSYVYTGAPVLEEYGVYGTGGGGGGGGGYSCSKDVKLNKGDTIAISIGSTCTVTITSTTGEIYDVMKCTTGKDGGDGYYSQGVNGNVPSVLGGTGSSGGVGSGGNYLNKTGGKGGSGNYKSYEGNSNSISQSQASGGAGGTAGYDGGNAGGAGGSVSVTAAGAETTKAAGAAKDGFCKIYRGNTNAA